MLQPVIAATDAIAASTTVGTLASSVASAPAAAEGEPADTPAAITAAQPRRATTGTPHTNTARLSVTPQQPAKTTTVPLAATESANAGTDAAVAPVGSQLAATPPPVPEIAMVVSPSSMASDLITAAPTATPGPKTQSATLLPSTAKAADADDQTSPTPDATQAVTPDPALLAQIIALAPPAMVAAAGAISTKPTPDAAPAANPMAATTRSHAVASPIAASPSFDPAISVDTATPVTDATGDQASAPHRTTHPALAAPALPITASLAPITLPTATLPASPVEVNPTPTAPSAIPPAATPSQAVSSPVPVTPTVDPLAAAAAIPPTAVQTLHPTEAPAPAPPANSAAPAHQVAAALVQIAHSPSGSAVTLRLDPAELGHVQIRIERGADGTSTVHVTAERPETLRLLVADQPQLHRTLDSAGLPQEGRSLSLSLATPDTANNSATDRGTGGNTSTGSGGFNNGSGSQQGGAWRQDRARYATASTDTPATHAAWLRAGVDITACKDAALSGSLITSPTLTSAANAGVTSAASSAASNSSSSSTNALTSLSSNFTSFLGLLLTQLQNQDPSSPMDTNTFTSELVQFSSVEQQITTNSSLTSLIQATQGSEVIQATGVVGKSVTVDSSQIALQNGSGQLNFNTTSAEPVNITISNSSGTPVQQVSLTSTAGSNTYTWNGKDSSGTTLPDGAYNVAISGTGAGGTTAAVPFTVTGTATGVTNSAGAVTLQVGGVSVDFSKIQSVAAGS
jgi:flagellar basal-body rod modification protein FlgD